MKNELIALIKPHRKRHLLSWFVKKMVAVFNVSLILCFFLVLASKFIVYENLYRHIMYIMIFQVLIGLILSCFTRPSVVDTAKSIDKLGLKERVATAVENIDAENEIIIKQREDAVCELKKLDKTKKIIFMEKKRKLYLAGILTAVNVVAILIPTFTTDEASYHRSVKREIFEQAIKIEEQLEKIEDLKIDDEEVTKKVEAGLKNIEKIKELTKKELKTEEIEKNLIKLEKNIDLAEDALDKAINGHDSDQLDEKNVKGALSERQKIESSKSLNEVKKEITAAKKISQSAENSCPTAKSGGT
jgi:hypothetical protein